jgi:hypothetical protein
MRPSDIQAQLRQRPFVPLRLHFTDGSTCDIRHPEMAMVSQTVISVGVYDHPESELPARIILMDPLHVVRLEPINGQTPGH